MVCPICLEEIRRDQTAYRIAPDVIVHYRRCKPSIENEIHVTGRRVAYWRFLLAALFLMSSMTLFAEEPQPQKGCLITSFNGSTGKPLFIFFVKVKDKDYDGEDGPEIWGYNIEDPPKEENGTYHLRNARADRFVLAGRAGSVEGRFCKCPPW